MTARRVGTALVSPAELPARFRVRGLLAALMRGDEPTALPWPARR